MGNLLVRLRVLINHRQGINRQNNKQLENNRKILRLYQELNK